MATLARVFLVTASLVGCDRGSSLDARAGRSVCEDCHRTLGADGDEHGIETAHALLALECVECHGGNPEGRHQAEAHEVRTATELRGKSAVGLTRDTSSLRFVNPSDLRIAQLSCGSLSPTGSSCHATTISTFQRSLTATAAGILTLPREPFASVPPVGVLAAVDDSDALATDAVPAIESFPHPAQVGSSPGELMDLYLRKACARCHAYDFGTSRLEGDFRSAGCGACHFSYAKDGRSGSADPALAGKDGIGPVSHELVRTPEEETCARCHAGGARIAFAFRGKAPAHATGYLEVTAVEEAQEVGDPDVHALAGMTCTDCHTGGELHGSPGLYVSHRQSPSVRCTDCHGQVDRAAAASAGTFRARGGWPMDRLVPQADGTPAVRLADGRLLPVPQLTSSEAPPEAHGAEHENLACASCHSRFTITCAGCHVTVDDSQPPMASLIDELWALGGAVSEEGFEVDVESFVLGEDADGVVWPIVPAQAVLLTHIDAEGATVLDRALSSTGELPIAGWAAIDPHTTGPARACEECHVSSSGDNADAVRRLVGAAPSELRIVDGEGTEWDIGRVLDDAFEPRFASSPSHARPLSPERARLLLENPLP